jgi:DNA-binding NarL/FixJ family response regulator
MKNKLRLLIVEDEPFTRQLVSNALQQQGFAVRECGDASSAIEHIAEFEPHVVISDLDLGSGGASGIDLLQHVERKYPWIGLVALTAHANPQLAASGELPSTVAYLVKSEISDLNQIGATVRATLSRSALKFERHDDDELETYRVSSDQAEALRMLASGMTNKSIAEARGTSVRAVENLISRTYAALGLDRDSSRNYRIEAVRLWQTGRVRVE